MKRQWRQFISLFASNTIDTMQKGLVDTEKIQKGIDKQKSKKSPSKRTQRAAQRVGRRGRRNYVELDDMDSDSDSDDEPIAAFFMPAHHARRQQHDPNTIVLDCDDVFIGGPAVNFTRDIAGASAVSVEQSQEMKVSVRINNKVEQFRMNAVSCQHCVWCSHHWHLVNRWIFNFCVFCLMLAVPKVIGINRPNKPEEGFAVQSNCIDVERKTPVRNWNIEFRWLHSRLDFKWVD